MRHRGSAGVLGTRLLGLTQRLRPVAAPCPLPAPAALREAVRAMAPILAEGGRRSVIAEISAAPPAAVPQGGAEETVLDDRHETAGAPYPAPEGVRPVTTRQEAGVQSPDARVCYVYGIVPAGTDLPEGLLGTGGGRVRLVRHGALAAVISEIPPAGALGSREDLLAHESVVAALSARTTMLPLRFSAVVTTADAVAADMLAPYYDWFTGILADLKGRSEFSVSGTYVQDTVLREVLAEEPEVMRLRESLRGLPEETGYYERVRLGELIVHALDAKREVDTEDLVQSLSRHAVAVAPRPPVNEDTAADAAFLVSDEDRADFQRAVDELGYRWAGRIRLHVLGPLAPYDFVPSPPGGPWG
ncbi:GvpL/GvpF family gas vesicle protein [Actinomadura sp. DC4]|uniref:GvpL/GvpF family gas vesicle protein n=1 Tax=Actinomadura sp. DC4 TaxID=3055069 RepID=UPI0025B0BC5F|nr:GvpL/GvpF family gas vesicle protein [Actinomadura sp. DC4]MDN3359358.1 GvpL/GvpF family gas vesicle protein [Actinomadura sp. DC4]